MEITSIRIGAVLALTLLILYTSSHVHIAASEYEAVGVVHNDAHKPILLVGIPDQEVWKRAQKIVILMPESHGVENSRGSLAGEFPQDKRGAYDTVNPLVNVYTTVSSSLSGVDMVILVPNDPIVKDYARRIAHLHEEKQGLRVRIVDTSEVRHYPRIVLPSSEKVHICSENPLYKHMFESIAKGYDYDLALRIVSFAKTLADNGVKYLLIIGGASDVPPLYYCSPLLGDLVNTVEAIIPTDYYYADPDFDGVAELAVGRIPFTDSLSLATYYSALEEWINGGDWQRLALVTGGATFLTILFEGEVMATTVANKLTELGLNVDTLLFSQGDYEGASLKDYIGRYGLYYIVAHGTGNSIVDYVPGGLWNYDVESKLYADEIGYAAKPGVYILPSCRDGYWDGDIIAPSFKPPSLAQALLARKAAVAYLGFARVTVEVVDRIQFTEGLLTLNFVGADRLLQLFVENLGNAGTLGEAWARALSSYNSLQSSSYTFFTVSGEEELRTLITRNVAFLGDPATPNPWKKTGQKTVESIGLSVEGGVVVGAKTVVQIHARYVSGTLYAVKPDNDTLRIALKGGCPIHATVTALRKALGYILVDVYPLDARIARDVDGCTLEVRVKPGIPGLWKILVLGNGTIENFYIVVAGAQNSDNSVVKLYGLDVLLVTGDEPLLVKLDNRTLDVISGAKTWAVIPVNGPGLLRVEPLYDYASVLGGRLVEEDYKKLLSLFTVRVSSFSIPEGLAFGKSEYYSLHTGQTTVDNYTCACRDEYVFDKQYILAATILMVGILANVIVASVSRKKQGHTMA